LYIPYRQEYLDPQRDLVTTVVTLGCNKSRSLRTGGTAPGFGNTCSLHLVKGAGVTHHNQWGRVI